MLVSSYSYLKMETSCSSETSVAFQLTTRRYIQEHSTLHNHNWQNLKSYIIPAYPTAQMGTCTILSDRISYLPSV
jgi:hypothetical protein